MTKSLRCLVSAAVLMAVVGVPVSYAFPSSMSLITPSSACKTDWASIDNYMSSKQQPVLAPCNMSGVTSHQVNYISCGSTTCCQVNAEYYDSNFGGYYWVTFNWTAGQWKSELTCK